MNIDQIIGKMMGDGSVGEEKSALESWKKEAEDNIKALEDIRAISKLTDGLKGYQDFDTDSAWKSLNAKVTESEPAKIITLSKASKDSTLVTKTETLKKSPFNLIYKIAAVAVLLMGALFAFNSLNSTDNAFKVQEYSSAENINLLDGTNILLDGETKLRTTSSRSVSMKGRAFFDVAKDIDNQFKVKLPVGEITVLGTKFTVVADDETTEVYLEEGKVKFTMDGSEWQLTPGKLLKVIDGAASVSTLRDKNYTSWKAGKLTFNDNSMQEVIDALNRHFGDVVELEEGQSFRNCSAFGVISGKNIDDALNELSAFLNLEIEIRDKKRVIVSAKC